MHLEIEVIFVIFFQYFEQFWTRRYQESIESASVYSRQQILEMTNIKRFLLLKEYEERKAK